jgi:AraC-like DNA-binding protein
VPVSPLVRELVLSISGGNLDSGARSTAMSLLVKLTLVTSSAELRLPSAVDARLARACSLVEDELTRRISIGDLAGSVGTSERTLSRLFRAEFGMTYPQWRSVLRVFHASVALAEGDSITGAAMRTGFSTPAAFATQFSRLTGHAPNQLLQRARP